MPSGLVVNTILQAYTDKQDAERTAKEKYALRVQAIAAILLIIGLATHIAPVGFIGLALIIFQTAFIGIIDEHALGHAFEEALPFTGLIVVFFVIVAMILRLSHDWSKCSGLFVANECYR